VSSGRRRVDALLVALLLLVNGIVLVNARLHDPFVGYDANAHFGYIGALGEGRLPTREDTFEFFTPPLAYVPAALLAPLGYRSLRLAGKVAQYWNVLWSVGLTLLLVKIARLLRPGDPALPRLALLLLGGLPVYYKTFAFVRPEPLLAFLAMAVLHEALRVFGEDDPSWLRVVGLGFLLGLLILTRQQGFFVIAATSLFAAGRMLGRPTERRRDLVSVAAALTVAFVVGGWFYLRLQVTQGSATAYVREPTSFSLANNLRSFYTGTGGGSLFRDPVRPAFRNQFLPTFYSETWGDYGCYFLVYGIDRRTHAFLSGGGLEDALTRPRAPLFLRTNYAEMARTLGRVNVVALVPSLFLLLGVLAALPSLAALVRGGERSGMHALLLLTVLVTAAAYAVLLVIYPARSGNMIKATYVLHVFPAVALLGADGLARVRERWPSVFRMLVVVLVAATLHNSVAFVTRYSPAAFTRWGL
jgi:Dolichyl-phosphate-mannose-protein mannosyltransferase